MDTLIQELERSSQEGTERNTVTEVEPSKAEPNNKTAREVDSKVTATIEKNQQKEQAAQPAKRSRMGWILGGALLISAAAGGYFYYASLGTVSTDDAQVDAHIAPIAPKIGGNVVEILVNDNQQVKAGEVLVRIDARDYEARVAQARAALAAAESQAVGAHAGIPLTLATTNNGISAAEAQLAAANAEHARAQFEYDRAANSEVAFARADVDAKRATAERARADLARMQPLAAKDEISKLQLDAYVAAARVAESDLNAAQQKLLNVQKSADSAAAAVQAAAARISAARAAVEQASANRQQVTIQSAEAGSASAAILQARANLEAAELQLSYTTITAPIDGVVTRKAVQLGQIVQPGQSLMTIVPGGDVWVTANFKETQLAEVKPGQRAEIYVDMYGRDFEGRVDSIASATGAKLSLLPPENATGNYVKIVQRIPVKITLAKVPDGFVFRPGMNVEAKIVTK